MIDIKGYQNGAPVFINPKKQITVEFSSEHTADRYNMYELDTVTKNWTYLGRDNSLVNKKQLKPNKQSEVALIEKKDSPKAQELQKQIDAIPPKIEAEKITYTQKVNQLPNHIEPNKPTKAIAGRPQFQLEVNYKEFPELAAVSYTHLDVYKRQIINRIHLKFI